MQNILIDTEDFKPRCVESTSNETTCDFDAELEIAEAFGSVPWTPKNISHDSKKPPQENGSQTGSRTFGSNGKDAEAQKFTTGGFESLDEPVLPSGAFKSGGFEDQAENGFGSFRSPITPLRNFTNARTLSFGNNSSKMGKECDFPPFSTISSGLQEKSLISPCGFMNGPSSIKAGFGSCLFGSGANNDADRARFSSGGFESPVSTRPFSPIHSSSVFTRNSETGFSVEIKPPVISGFGCSNETIARLPGRIRGRGRRGNGDRRRRSRGRTDSRRLSSPAMDDHEKTATGTHSQPSTAKVQSVKSFSPFSQISNNNNEKEQPQQNEVNTESITVGGRRPSSFGQEPKEEVPSKRPCRLSCMICGKTGHSSDDCFRNPKNQSNREGIRCYNCNERGHMAVRCTKPPIKGSRRRISSTKSGRKDRKTSTTENGRKEVTSTQNKLSSVPPIGDLKGLEVICKLMKDKHMREEAAKKTPQLYDEMLTYMIEHVNLNVSSK